MRRQDRKLNIAVSLQSEESLCRHRNDPYHRNDLRHRNDPHHRNDTGGHHRNDPRNIGNEIKRTTKTGQQFRACFLFIYIASFLRCVIYLFTALYFAVNCLLVFFWFNTRQYLFKRCISLMSSISSNFFSYFCKKINLLNQCIELLSV